MLNSGFSHLCHHTIHWEWCSDYAGRVEYIRANKPQEEVETRLRWFVLIPNDRLPPTLVTAGGAFALSQAACSEAWTAYSKAKVAYSKVWWAWACSKAWWACSKAWRAYRKAKVADSKAMTAYDKALAAAAPELAVLHDELFPDCPWNEEQRTMFPDGEEK